MIFHRLGLLNKKQRGVTLVELVVALAIVGIIAGATTTTIFQVTTGSSRTSDHMTAIRQVQNVGYWISQDSQMAQVVITDDPDTVLTLVWVGWEYDCGGTDKCIDAYEVCYTYDSNNNEIWRYETITTNKYDTNGDLIEGPFVVEGSAPIAEYITPIPTATMDSDKLVVTITASVNGAEEQRVYKITPRPSVS